MEPRAKVRRLAGKQLLLTARNRSLVADRPLESGGTDLGFTSGELLLLAVGSCSTGAVRNFLEGRGIPCPDIGSEVYFEAGAGARDRIVIELALSPAALAPGAEAIKAAAVSGRVTSRVKLGSEIEVRIAGAAS
jgi:hypothetical protein